MGGYFSPVSYSLSPKVNIFLYFMTVSCDRAACKQHLGKIRVTLKYEVRNTLEATIKKRPMRWFSHMQPVEGCRRAKQALHWMPVEKHRGRLRFLWRDYLERYKTDEYDMSVSRQWTDSIEEMDFPRCWSLEELRSTCDVRSATH